MDLLKFINKYLLPNISLYIRIMIICMPLEYLIYKKFVYDKREWFYLWSCYLGSVFSIIITIFMYKVEIISSYYLINFFITTVLFYFSLIKFEKVFLTHKKFDDNSAKSLNHAKKQESVVLLWTDILFVIWFLLFFLSVKILGANRIGNDGGGTGAITRISLIVNPLFRYAVVYLLFSDRPLNRFRGKIYLILLIFSVFFGHSRSALINIFFTIYIFSFLNTSNNRCKRILKKYGWTFVVFGFLGAVAIVLIMGTGKDMLSSISAIAIRFMAYGDCNIYAYPNDVIKGISEKYNFSFIKYLLSDFLTTYQIGRAHV